LRATKTIWRLPWSLSGCPTIISLLKDTNGPRK
jgi:hypothetical protein